MKVLRLNLLAALLACACSAAFLGGASTPVRAAEFMGVEVDGPALDYIVLRDVNVRSKPDTKSKRLAGLKKGTIIHSPGRHLGWVAVLDTEKPVGFAYKKYLLPVIDGTLINPVVGTASIASGGTCTFTIEFVGKSDASSALFKMADYETIVWCQYNGESVSTTMFMFMTEGPMTRAKPNLHQIGMDVLEIESEDGYEDVFSTNVLFDHEKQSIRFDGVSLKGYSVDPRETQKNVTSVVDALTGAVQMALESWNDKTWKELSLRTD